MENHHHHRRWHHRHDGVSFSLFLLFLISSSLLPSPTFSAYNPDTKTFLNCGASSAATKDGRPFVADATISDDYQFTGPTVNLTNPNSSNASPSSIYVTARVSSATYSYELSVESTGTHFLRLHFSPFTATRTGTTYNLSNATFSVSAHDTLSLLTNFSPAGQPLPIVKEYLLWATSDNHLNLTFTPAANSIAFVNAVELFTAPDDFILRKNTTYITEKGAQNFDGAAPENAMETMFHINAGGSPIEPINDTLWRVWINDERFLKTRRLAQKSSTTRTINYRNNTIPTREFAPASVYSTAEKMDVTDPYRGTRFNVTWVFEVSPGHKYLVRMHFCDLNTTFPDKLYFNVYLNNMTATQDLHPADYTDGSFFTPFFLDYIVDVGTPGEVFVSVGSSTKMSDLSANAILNGLEIMRMNNSAGSLDGDSSSSNRSNSSGGNQTVVVAAAVAGGVVLLIIVGFLVLCLCKRKKGSRPPARPSESCYGRGGSTGMDWTSVAGANGNSTSMGTGSTGVLASPRVHFCLQISLEELKLATKNFDSSLIIGSGGFGKVYFGHLRDGTPVAVKRGTKASKQGNPEFQNEISVLSQIRHRHLVSLIGYCDESNQMILVYEYMNKGTLRSHLYESNSDIDGNAHHADADSNFLSWKQRLRICIGSARGLHYLHTGYSPGIIHRDVKSSNILLTEEEDGVGGCLAKVSDFGLSRVGPDAGETHVSTAVKGSFGYLDPEYFKTQKLTEKSDVYSFGVVLFEVLCARPAIDPKAAREEMNLAEWAVGKQRDGLLEEIVDWRLKGKVNLSSLRKFGETAEKCLAEDGWERPTMGDVLWNLEYALQLQEAETRREMGTDSIVSDAQISAPVVDCVRYAVPIPTGGGGGGGENSSMVTTDSGVFSQLITGYGR